MYFDVEQLEKLKKLSEKTRVPQSVYIRDGLDLVLKMHEKKRKKQVNRRTKQVDKTSLRLLKK